MKNYKAVIFDFDGTLVDSDYIIVDSALKAGRNFGFSKKELSRIKLHFKENMGLNSEIIFKNILPSLKGRRLAEFDREFHRILIPRFNHTFPYVSKVMRYLEKRGIKLAICTSSPHRTARKKVRFAGLPSLFSVVLGKEEFPKPRPAPDGILKACKLMKVSPRETIYVGDTRFDLMSGKRAGCYTIAFRPKFLSMSRARPDATIRSWKNFPKTFARLNR